MFMFRVLWFQIRSSDSFPLKHSCTYVNSQINATWWAINSEEGGTWFYKKCMQVWGLNLNSSFLLSLLFLVCKSSHTWELHLKPHTRGFPGGAVVESLPANAGDTGSSPGLGRSHMPRSKWACEPQLLSLRVWSLCSTTREAATVRGLRTAMKSGPHLPQLEKARAQKRRPNTPKNK